MNGAAVTFGIESANIVGYQQTGIREAYSLKVASFDQVGVDGLSIQCLIPIAEEGLAIGGGVFDLQTLDDVGAMSEQFYYMTKADDGVPQDGWYNDDGETLATKVFKRGEGFMYNNSIGAAASLQISGQVNKSEVLVEACESYSLIGNIRPCKISIQDMLPVAEEGLAIGGGVFDLQTLDDVGAMEQQFYYMTKADDGMPKDGWYNDDGETFATKEFEPAEGFMFNNSTGAKAGLKFMALSL